MKLVADQCTQQQKPRVEKNRNCFFKIAFEILSDTKKFILVP